MKKLHPKQAQLVFEYLNNGHKERNGKILEV
jgi:hypothetical protein